MRPEFRSRVRTSRAQHAWPHGITTPRRSAIATLLLAALLGASGDARAQDAASLAGSWRAGTRSVTNRTTSWGADCPPRPPASESEPGGSVTITHTDGQLRFAGALRGTTRSCFSQQPGLRRTSASAMGTSWSIRCATPESVAQGESGQYTFRAESTSRLVFDETTRWDWQLNESRCQATRTAHQVLTRVGAAPSTPSEPAEPATTMEEVRPGCTPGAATRVRLSAPESVAPGERVCLSRQVVDASGCALSATPTLRLTAAPTGFESERISRCFEATLPGTYVVEARHEALRAEVRVVVGSEVDVAGLRATGGAGSMRTGATEASGASALAARAGEGARPLFIGLLLAGVLSVIGIGLVVVARRRARAAPRAPSENTESSAPTPAPSPSFAAPVAPPPPARICPTCDRRYGPELSRCPEDGAALIDPSDPRVQAQGLVCPSCRRGYPLGASACSDDGTPLVLYALFAARAKSADSRQCPKCAKRFGANVTFCPDDGTPLVEQGS